ncbi:protein of unknown function DUF899, thioredoxin family protein [Glarea lozoyensis ATCC 20868]|uniref:DUF899-domain-containing protein n=1 Tax=Glarea lozoyensis (strain ATCC 20868 / MF5171) TaxID=1116229 RepID=S3E1U3_GLAL2|nr:protein of unknown function DUF899, thioredoxin family protein [Glarea lozoyensis ATCC 20868]EPE32453.1 protein of unknown function DUF899, thioredoxin family protein [Glarea lozoyensis ATCC 20868]
MPGPIVTPSEWLIARKTLLTKEKAALATTLALRHELQTTFPMTLVEKDYTFTTTTGPVSLPYLFHGRKQLIIYHFMLGPDEVNERACVGCSFVADHIPRLGHLNSRDTTLVVVSRAPIERIMAFKTKMGWTFPWVSSLGSEFNYDFQATLDEEVKKPVVFNYKETTGKGERPGLSVFVRREEGVCHSYSTYARGLEGLMGTYALLDWTPGGRRDGGRAMGWMLSGEYEGEGGRGGCACEDRSENVMAKDGGDIDGENEKEA